MLSKAISLSLFIIAVFQMPLDMINGMLIAAGLFAIAGAISSNK